MNYFRQFENEVIWVLEQKEERNSWDIAVQANVIEFTF